MGRKVMYKLGIQIMYIMSQLEVLVCPLALRADPMALKCRKLLCTARVRVKCRLSAVQRIRNESPHTGGLRFAVFLLLLLLFFNTFRLCFIRFYCPFLSFSLSGDLQGGFDLDQGRRLLRLGHTRDSPCKEGL